MYSLWLSIQFGRVKNFIAIIAAIKAVAMVVKIAIPPPKGMTFWWNLSASGWATKPRAFVILPVIATKIADEISTATDNPIADNNKVEILHLL